MTHEDTETPRTRTDLGAARLLIGLAQGVALLLLVESQAAHAWPATDQWLFGTLMVCVMFVPLTVLVGLGQMRPVTLTSWIVGTIALIAVLVWHSVTREVDARPETGAGLILFPLVPVILFISFHLIAASDADRRFVAEYRTYFDIAWKNGVQLALSLAFLGAFWLLLFLGAELFGLIRIEIVREIIRERWFAYPATTTVFALAVHVTDVRVGLINGIRAVALVLLSWLLPVMTGLVVAFLAALPATGLVPLWATGSATAILLTAAATLVILINAAYQDGEPEKPPHSALQIAARIAGLALVPLVLIAAYSIWLRVAQHGLTPERVIGLAIIAVAACYAAGYAIAALWPGRWFKPLELTNFAGALVALGLLIAGLTPIGDPARIAVDDQLRRLRSGLVTVEQFDFNFLRHHAARYGLEALQALARDKSSPRAQAIAAKAEEALKRDAQLAVPQPPASELLARIVVRPSGKLPDSFINQDWSMKATPTMLFSPVGCAANASPASPCVAYLLDLDGDGVAEVLVGNTDLPLYAFQLSPDGVWRIIGYYNAVQCGSYVRSFLDAGRFQLVPSKYQELEMQGQRLRLQGCPE
jgi:hypothetical protein